MRKDVALFGFYASLAAFVAAAGYCVVQVLQVLGVIVYPWDDTLIYESSLCIAPPFLIAMAVLQHMAPGYKKFWGNAALMFALMYTVYVVLMYTVQLAVVMPLSRRDHHADLLRVTPHSFFWTLDALGYICMGISTAFAACLFKKQGRQRWLRRFLMANGIMVPVITLVYFYPHFSTGLLLLGSPWMITAPGSMLLLALFFKRIADLNDLESFNDL